MKVERPRRTRWAMCCLVAALVWPHRATATASYPSVLKTSLGLNSNPECTLCHSTPRGGPGTAKTSFAKALKGYGLEGRGNRASLETALKALLTGDIDTDGDGTLDVEELRLGRSPSEVDATPGHAGAPNMSHGGASESGNGEAGASEGGRPQGLGGALGGGAAPTHAEPKPAAPAQLVGVVSCQVNGDALSNAAASRVLIALAVLVAFRRRGALIRILPS